MSKPERKAMSAHCATCGMVTQTTSALIAREVGMQVSLVCAKCAGVRPDQDERPVVSEPAAEPASPPRAPESPASVVRHPSAGRTAAELAADARVRLSHVERELERMVELRAERAALRRMLRGVS